MRTLLLMLFCFSAAAQPAATPPQVYSQHTRLGMNGRIKHVTTYKYTRLKYKKGKETEAKGTLYSVIKNYYDTSGLITHDSTVMYYNPKQALGYCKTYNYDMQDNKHLIRIATRFDCMPPYDNHHVDETIVELTTPNDSTILAKEYKGNTLLQKQKKPVSTYRFILRNGLLQKTVFDAMRKGRELEGTSTYKYDSYNNFTETTLKVGVGAQQVITHKISNIDDYGNALRMLNYTNGSPTPEFMTIYEYEYYE